MFENKDRLFVELVNLNGEKQKVEIFAQIKSKRDNKLYVLLTPDEIIKEEVNMSIGYIYEENNKMNLELVENEEEINYVYSLINSTLMEV